MGIGTAVALLGLGKTIYEICTARIQHKAAREKLYIQRQDHLLATNKAQQRIDTFLTYHSQLHFLFRN